MVKVVITKLGTARTNSGRLARVLKKQRVQGDLGMKTITMIDTGSQTFSSDLTQAFTQNVSKARRENKRVTGTTDRVPAKA